MSVESDPRLADQDKAERELQRYLGGDSPLSTKYRAQSREITPPQLDSAVLAHAQQQLQSAFATNRGQFVRRRNRRWAIPLATAATMLVGVNLVWQLRDQAVPEIASGAAYESTQRSAPMAAPAPAPQAKLQQQRDESAAAELDVAERESRQMEERAAARSAPAESLAADADAGAKPEIAASVEAPVAAAVEQQTLADTAGEPQAKRAQAGFEESRSAGRPAPPVQAPQMQQPQMLQQRADSAPMQRERKAFAASGFAAAAPAAAAPAPAPVLAENPAQDAARTLLRHLRLQDLAALRIEFNAADLSSDMLNAAAYAAAALGREAQIETGTAGDGLWRFDYRNTSQDTRMIAMLQQSGSEWTLLSVEVLR